MDIKAIFLTVLVVGYFFFVFSFNIFGKFMSDKSTLIASGITSVVTVVIAFLIPEDLRESATIGFACLAMLTGLLQFFKK